MHAGLSKVVLGEIHTTAVVQCWQTWWFVFGESRLYAPIQQVRYCNCSAGCWVCYSCLQTQVKWLEGILAAFILAIAAFSGRAVPAAVCSEYHLQDLCAESCQECSSMLWLLVYRQLCTRGKPGP